MSKKPTFESATLDYADKLHAILDSQPRTEDGAEAPAIVTMSQDDFLTLIDVVDRLIGTGYRYITERDRYIGKLEVKVSKLKSKLKKK